MKIVGQDRPVSGSRHRAERLRHDFGPLYETEAGLRPVNKGPFNES
jgi:hypothetical protein